MRGEVTEDKQYTNIFYLFKKNLIKAKTRETRWPAPPAPFLSPNSVSVSVCICVFETKSKSSTKKTINSTFLVSIIFSSFGQLVVIRYAHGLIWSKYVNPSHVRNLWSIGTLIWSDPTHQVKGVDAIWPIKSRLNLIY